MSYIRNDSSGCEAIGCLASLVFGLIIPLVQIFIEKSIYKNVNFLYSAIAILIIISICISVRNNKLNKKCKEMQSEMHKLEYQTERKIAQITNEYKNKESVLLRQINDCHTFAECSAPFTFSATLQADMKTAIFEEGRKELTYKKRPARKAAEIIQELKVK